MYVTIIVMIKAMKETRTTITAAVMIKVTSRNVL